MPGRASAPTLKDIAAATGFSVSAVSYALRNHPRIPVETRERIQSSAAKLGYKPDARLGQLMAHLKSRRQAAVTCPLAWINSSPDKRHWRTTPWAREFYSSACDRAAQLGYSITEIWVHDPRIVPAKLDSVLKARGIQGLILSTPLIDQTWTHWIDWGSYAAVVIDDPFALPQLDRVYALYAENMRAALDQLRLRGYRRPKIWLAAYDDYWTAYGYTRECLRDQRLRPGDDSILTDACDDPSDKALLAWIKTHKPDVVIGRTAALGQRLRDLGLKIPQDIGYLAMYVLDADDEWSGIGQLHRIQSPLAIEHLASLLQMNLLGPPPHPRHIQIRGEWREGTTLRPLPAQHPGLQR